MKLPAKRLLQTAIPAVLLLLLGLAVNLPAAPARPHIIVVLTDDMGCGDLTCYGKGTGVTTTHLDRLAAEGTRFTQFYVTAPICSPSRCGLLTGQHPGRWRLNSFLQTRAGNRVCGQEDYLDPKAPTIPRLLQTAGYATAHFGKWHLGGGRDVTNAPSFQAYGYDEHASTWESPEPHPDITATNWIWSPQDKVKRWDRTAFFVDKTLDFLRRHKDRPCFVNLWPDDTHTPHVPAPALRARYGGTEDGKQTIENFRGVIEDYDRQMGRLMEGLRTLGIEQDTLLIFTADNGPAPSFDHERTGGLRGQKLSLYEGGIREPFLVRWPGHVPAGRVDERSVLSSMDLLPTLCRLAGASTPKAKASRPDGEDISVAFLGQAYTRSRPLFWEYGRQKEGYAFPKDPSDRSPNVATREGAWKLLVNDDGTGAELYDVVADPRETRNLAAANQDAVERLKNQALAWRRSLPGKPVPPTKSEPKPAASAPRPNILVIISDDMGYSDLGCYGGEVQTPTLDGLAKNGLRFTQFYNVARCCPTRASLLTGLYPHQAGMGHMTGRGSGRDDGYAGDLTRRSATMAEALRPAGYRTYACGKWHVAKHIAPEGPRHAWPLQRGFDRFYGTITGGGSFYDPTTLCRDNTYITPENDPEYQTPKFYYTDAISDNAVRFLRDHQKATPALPFFMYVAYTAAHWPMHALPGDIAKYRGRYDQGYGPVREARFARMREMGLLDPAWGLSPQAGDWSAVTNKDWEARGMEVYAAMIDRMDQGIARIVAELKAQGKLDNTLLVFLQDNGGCAESMGRESNAQKVAAQICHPMAKDELQPCIWPPMQTRDGRPVRTGPEVMPGPEDTYIAYGKGWANVSDTPFREYKHWVHEGGISTPLVVHWPAGIPAARRNSFVREPSHLIDIMATCVDVSGATYPDTLAGTPIQPMEGVSLRPLFEGGRVKRPRPLCWEHEGNRAIREGRWKLVAKENQPWELYDMKADRSELHDLASQRPAQVQKMAARWEAWAGRCAVLPLGGWRLKPEKK